MAGRPEKTKSEKRKREQRDERARESEVGPEEKSDTMFDMFQNSTSEPLASFEISIK